MRYPYLTMLLTLTATLTGSLAEAVVIDDFTVFQFFNPSSTPASVTAMGSITGTSSQILGTERDLRVVKNGGSSSLAIVNGGELQLSAGATSTLNVYLQWDGLADGTKEIIDDDGLAFVDFTDGGYSDAILANVGNGLSPVTATFTIWAEDGLDSNVTTIVPTTNTITILPNFNDELVFFFEDFLTPVDFTKVAAAELHLALPMGGSIDFQLLSTVDYIPMAPEPNMLAILGPLMAGLAWKRRRALKKAQTA